jgi:hypothetical protein
LSGLSNFSTTHIAGNPMKKFTLSSLALLSALASTGVLAQGVPSTPRPTAPGLPAGLYVSVNEGAIILSNKGGSTSFTAGQFGYTASTTTPPVIVPANPGIKFTLPPAFVISSNGAGPANKSAAVDCEVR